MQLTLKQVFYLYCFLYDHILYFVKIFLGTFYFLFSIDSTNFMSNMWF